MTPFISQPPRHAPPALANLPDRPWRLGAVALALALAWGQAQALSLGRLSVQSALGEPLRAEVAITDITADEAASLKATLAPPEAFKVAGIEYNSNLTNLRIVFEQRGDGRAALVLTTTKPVTEPFLDLILEANWANGKISRDYTLLLDPPTLKAEAARSGPAVPQPVVPFVTPDTRPARRGTPSLAVTPKLQPRPSRVPTPKQAAAPKQVVVKPGDTAGRIAAATKPAAVSLDQMLVAMLNANPDAFIDNNVNRLRAGAVLNVPSRSQAASTPPAQARQTIAAQSRDFGSYKTKLASNVTTRAVGEPGRQATGKLEARVTDKPGANAPADKLQLSKGGLANSGKASPEEALAKARAAQEATNRVAELNKNVDDLNKLSAQSPAGLPAAAAVGAAASAAASAPGLTGLTVPAAPAASVAASSPALSASAPTEAPSPPASAAVPAASSPAPASSVAPAGAKASEPKAADFDLAGALEGKEALLGLGALLVALLGLALVRARRRRRDSRPTAFMDSMMQAEPVYGPMGGQRIDTRDKDVGDSTMGFSPSQLDAASDVDPVVEAEVYLAYGRDVQAEEILKEALRIQPNRVPVHLKLAEIYAKRRDMVSFEATANQVGALTQRNGADWAHIEALRPNKPKPLEPTAAPLAATPDRIVPSEPLRPAAAQAGPATPPAVELPPLELDIGLSPSNDQRSTAAPAAAPLAAEPRGEPKVEPLEMLDFKLDQLDIPASVPTATPSGVAASPERLGVKLELAKEFMAIGDDEGARALAQEVLAEATGDLKVRAQQLLTSLR